MTATDMDRLEMHTPEIEEALLIIAEGLAADPTEEARMSEAVLRNAAAELAQLRQTSQGELRIVFDGPPGPESGRFVECETATGRSVNAGEWRARKDGLWELVITALPENPAKIPDGYIVICKDLLRTE